MTLAILYVSDMWYVGGVLLILIGAALLFYATL